MECRKTIKGKKIWVDSDNKDNTRPPFVQIVLLRNGAAYQTFRLSDDTNNSYVFMCLPIYDRTGQKYDYTVDEVQMVDGYTKEIDGFNVINTLQMVGITYVFNNLVHIDYEGKVYTEESVFYPKIKPITLPAKSDVFPEYTGDCEFVGWNTLSNGSGTYYYPDDVITIDQDLTLYAIWRSCEPQVNTIHAGDITVRGYGIVSAGNINSIVWVAFPGMNPVATYTTSNGSWSMSVPIAVRPLQAGTVVTVTQYERGKLVSNPVSAVVVT